MIRLSTPVDIPRMQGLVSYDTPLLLLGSCFTENIGSRLSDLFFNADINPFGETYNPLSIMRIAQRIRSGEPFVADELVEYGGLWHSMMHHGIFSGTERNAVLDGINTRLEAAHQELMADNCVAVLTLGTAYVYECDGDVVNNCHKMPSSLFTRRRMSVEQTIDVLESAIGALGCRHTILTVSPVRHLRDGAHDNNISKGTLLLAVDDVVSRHDDVSYFPAYEVLLDELRDYRFYADDLAHPSAVAQDIIFGKFSESYMDASTRSRMELCGQLRERLNHRFLHPDSDQAREFRKKTEEMKKELGI